jgi:hypothetical protein
VRRPESPFRRSDGATTVEEPWPVVEEEVAPPPPPPGRGPLFWPWLLLPLLLVLGGLAAAWYFTHDNGARARQRSTFPSSSA